MTPFFSKAHLKRFGFLSLLGVAGALVVSTIGYVALFGIASWNTQSMQEPTVSDGRYVYRAGNFSLALLPGWKEIPAEEVNLPQDLTGLGFSLQKEGTSCVLSYITMGPGLYERYKQSSFADRVFAGATQIDSSWYVHVGLGEERPQFSDHTRQPISGEIRVDPYAVGAKQYGIDLVQAFVLFANDGGTVADECSSDMSTMLATLTPVFEPTTLTATSRGALFLHGEEGVEGKQVSGLMTFRSDTDEIFYEIQKTDAAAYPSNPSVYGSTLYFARDGIYTLNPFTKEEKLVAGTKIIETEAINDFYITEDFIYYLSGPPCDGRSCVNRLVQVPRAGGEAKVLADTYRGNRILGYAADERRLYLLAGWGDAGCISLGVSAFDLPTQSLGLVENFIGCEGDTEIQAANARYRALEARVSGRTSVSYVRVEQGTLIAPESSTAPMLPYTAGIPLSFYDR